MAKLTRRLEGWNRRLHIHGGLFFLLFIWLFAITGLLLNHPRWETTKPQRDRSESIVTVAPVPQELEEMERARALMDQLELRGEVQRIRTTEEAFEFRVQRPGRIVDVRTETDGSTAQLIELRSNTWSILNSLHQFNAVSMDNPQQQRTWFMTTLWTLAMDIVSIGLIFLVFSGIYMWYRLGNKRIGGAIALTAGILCCGLFIWGLGWWMGP